MLSQMLREITQSKEPITLAALSQKLNIESGALEGMLAYWVRKGRLHDEDEPSETSALSCASSACGSTCTGFANCAFVARMPKTYSLRQAEKPENTPGRENVLETKKR